jgi:phytoene synthase
VSVSSVELELGYRRCAREVRAAAGNFYYAFRLLPAEKRQGLHALYRFCRGADDIADAPEDAGRRLRRLESYRSTLERSLAGDPPDAGWLILLDTAQRFSLSPQHLHQVIDGCAADCRPMRIRSERELADYCYGVAGVVGLLSARIFRYQDPQVERLAVALGEAMQRTNILRDLGEDLAAGRRYLPDEVMERFQLTEEDLLVGGRGPNAHRYRDLMAHEVELARDRFRTGLQLVPLVERDARGCPAALAALYQALLDRIERDGYDVQGGRVRLSSRHKVGLAMVAWASATLRP